MTPARPRSPRGEGERLRDEILDAAETLLIETGSEEAVSIRAVADRVGVSAPSIYRHFDDKQTMLFEVCSLQMDRFHEHLISVMDLEVDPMAKLRACGRAYVQFGLDHPEHYRIMFMGRSDWTPETYADEVLTESGSFMALVAVVSEVLTELGSDRDPFATAVIVWTGVHGLTSLMISKPNFPWPPVDELVADCCESLLVGLLSRE